MNTTVEEGRKLAAEVNSFVVGLENNDIGVAIAPPFTHLTEIAKSIDNDAICLTAQNCASESRGAYTGEISVGMLKAAGVKAVILGHSERRAYFREDYKTLAKKTDLVLEQEIKPIFCIGETLDEREAGIQADVVKKQLSESLFHLQATSIQNLILAYEPVWAIGTGKTASPEQAQEMHKYIRLVIAEKYGNDIADNLTILYGGSCKPSNAREIFSQADVDGGLIGGAALKAEDFGALISSF